LQPLRPRFLASSGLHREIHWLAFAGTGFSLLLLSGNRRQELRSLVAACLLGPSIEYFQYVIYGAAFEWGDVRDDFLAVLAGFVLYRLASISPLFRPVFCPDEVP
jgi:hypothetical protein